MKNQNWLIYREGVCLSGYYGTYAEAKDFAFDKWGIGCMVVAADANYGED